MKKTLIVWLGLSFHTVFGAGITTANIAIMANYLSKYYNAIERLREGTDINRGEIIKKLEKDPFLTREKTADGHAKFTHQVLPLTFCVIAHGTQDITSKEERRELHKDLQVYVNVIKLFLQGFPNLTTATTAFNQMTTSNWQERITAELAAFAEYSRQ